MIWVGYIITLINNKNAEEECSIANICGPQEGQLSHCDWKRLHELLLKWWN